MGTFIFEDDLLKHYVRTWAWLPTVKRRLAHVRELAGHPSRQRRLRYFTFCAVGAIDVLMLDVANIVRPSANGFDTVVFFDRTPEAVFETQKNIPGALGIVGDFTTLVLMPDGEGDAILEVGDELRPPVNAENRVEVRKAQRDRWERRQFIQRFPFDVINLDIEEFVFKGNDELPGKVANSLIKICEWQKRPIEIPGKAPLYLDSFSFMFTTQVGPRNIREDYLDMLLSDMLLSYLKSNLIENDKLMEAFQRRTGTGDADEVRRNDFALFFKLALPKLLANIAMMQDWFVDPAHGISVYEIERNSKDGPYKILHLVMDIRRQPWRPPGPGSGPGVTAAYHETVLRVFQNDAVQVVAEILDAPRLNASLDRIKGRRKKYNPEQVS